MADFVEQFCVKEPMGFFRRADKTPPVAEWQHASELFDAAPDCEFSMSPRELWPGGKRKKLYFRHANLLMLEPHLRKKLKPGQVECKYGPSPEKPTTLLFRAANCPLFVVRQVPVECELFQDIFNKATDVLSLQKGKQLVYKGESASQRFERLRIEVSRPNRRQLTNRGKADRSGKAKQRMSCVRFPQ